jgi:hypothetical protein
VSTNEELLERKNSCSGLKNRDYCRRGIAATPLNLQKSVLPSPTTCGLSVVIFRSRTQATECVRFCFVFHPGQRSGYCVPFKTNCSSFYSQYVQCKPVQPLKIAWRPKVFRSKGIRTGPVWNWARLVPGFVSNRRTYLSENWNFSPHSASHLVSPPGEFIEPISTS